MKERVTFVHGANDPFTPEQLRLDNDTLCVKSLKAAREDRSTFGLHELPQELRRVLKQCHELHIRWASPVPYASTAPFVSRLSPGLHVFFTPQRNRSGDALCPLLQKVFGGHLKCTSPEETFTALPMISDRFSSSTAFQYYSPLPSLIDLITYLQQKICQNQDPVCLAKTSTLNPASYLDIDYDTISQAFVLTTFQHAPHADSGPWSQKISALPSSAKLEIGVLASEKPTNPEEVSLGGFLATLGEEAAKLSPTLFSFPSRHHSSSQIYTATLPTPIGLHPTLRLILPSPLQPPADSACTLHTHLTLPSSLFVDKYQLSSPNLLVSKNLRAIRALSGETDLEAPDWIIKKWGSAVLVELAPPPPSVKTAKGEGKVQAQWHADIPLHLRYLPPAQGGSVEVEVPWPVVFWACSAEEGTKMGTNPFERGNLGYEGFFGPRTMFFHLLPEGKGTLTEKIQVPVLNLEGTMWVEGGTIAVVVLGFLWIVSVLGGRGKGVQHAKRSSGNSNKVDPADQVSVVGADAPAVTSGAKAYDERWIPAGRLERPKAKRVQSARPSGSTRHLG